MPAFKELKQKLNNESEELYDSTIEEIKKIQEDTEKSDDNLIKYANKIEKKILFFDNLKKEYSSDWYSKKTIEELKEINHKIYDEVKPENYETCFANPEYCDNFLKKGYGSLFAEFYSKFRNYVTHVSDNAIYEMAKWNDTFLKFYSLINENDYEKIEKFLVKTFREIDLDTDILKTHKNMNPKATEDIKNFILNADISDDRYMYQYLNYISENEIKISKFLRNYPEEKIETLADGIVKGFQEGFIRDNKDISKKENVMLIYNVGEERIIKKIIPKLEKNNLKPIFNRINSSDFNKQYQYDHKFNIAIYLNEKFVQDSITKNAQRNEICADILKKFAGPIAISQFGEQPFSPKNKDANAQLSQEQRKLYQKMNIEQQQDNQKYMPRNEYSFCMIAFPTPEIGGKFEDIYEKTFEINMLKSAEYEKIQKNIIDELDKADHVHILGKGDNKTDLKIQLQELKNPEKETNFVNCGANVNIPVGEVFTSPHLKGTTGILHVTNTYLAKLNYKDIELKFEDGFVKDYNCKNFDEEKKNKEYIENNLLFPHKTLPMGEFAIGTNTLAYVMAQEYKIGKLLPILIGEKMGPHFAIGDTCFSWGEDDKTYNPIDNKEIKSKDNEKTIARKDNNYGEAYTNCHTDITIPYEELGSITAVTKDGKKIPIIVDGKFVVKGTEKLNKPLEEYGI